MARYYDEANQRWVSNEDQEAQDPRLALQAAGYLPASGWTGDQVNWQYMQGGGGQQFANEKEYYDWLYGPGGTYQEIGGENYYLPPGGMGSFLPGRTPLVNATPDSKMSTILPALWLAMATMGAGSALAGGEAAAGALAGGEAAAGGLGSFPTLGELGSGAYNIGAGGASGLSATGGALGSGTAGVAGASSLFPAAGSLGLGAGSLGTLGTAAGATGGTAATTAATPTASGSVLSRIIDGSATPADYASLAGTGISTGLGVLGSTQQADAYEDVANQYLSLGAPSRARLEASYAPGFSMENEPGYKDALDLAANSAARSMSAKVGNPVENPGAYGEIQKYVTSSTALPQLNTYRSQNLTGGGLGVNTAGTASGAAAGQTGGLYNAIGYGVGQLTQPQNNTNSMLSDLLKKYATSGGNLF